MKKIFTFLLIALLLISLPLTASADGNGIFLQDEANLLTSEEASRLEERLEALSETYGAQITIVTTDSIGSRNIDYFIADLYDENGFGYGEDAAGVLFLICMDSREFRILCNGFAADAIPSDYIADIAATISSDLSYGNYADAFHMFADECEYYLNGYINGFAFDWQGSLILALVIGLVIALIVVFVLKGQLKSVHREDRATLYVRPGSMHLTQQGDYFLYRTVRRTRKPKSNSSGGSRGGSRSIGGGKF